MGIRFFHILMASLIFISTIGVTVNRHYCQQQLRSTGLWWKPKSCHDAIKADAKLPSCPFHQKKTKDEKRKCCSEESNYVKTETVQDFIFDDFSLTQFLPDFLFSTFTFENHFPVFRETEYAVFCFHPPPDEVSLQVLYQRFLI